MSHKKYKRKNNLRLIAVLATGSYKLHVPHIFIVHIKYDDQVWNWSKTGIHNGSKSRDDNSSSTSMTSNCLPLRKFTNSCLLIVCAASLPLILVDIKSLDTRLLRGKRKKKIICMHRKRNLSCRNIPMTLFWLLWWHTFNMYMTRSCNFLLTMNTFSTYHKGNK